MKHPADMTPLEWLDELHELAFDLCTPRRKAGTVRGVSAHYDDSGRALFAQTGAADEGNTEDVAKCLDLITEAQWTTIDVRSFLGALVGAADLDADEDYGLDLRGMVKINGALFALPKLLGVAMLFCQCRTIEAAILETSDPGKSFAWLNSERLLVVGRLGIALRVGPDRVAMLNTLTGEAVLNDRRVLSLADFEETPR